MSDIDLIRANLRRNPYGALMPSEIVAMCDEIDALRARLAEADVSPSVAACLSDMAAEILALRAKVAAVAALCAESERSNDEFDGFPDAYVDTRDLRAAISGPVDDA